MYNEKKIFLTVSWLSGLLSAEIFISTGECGVQMPPLTSENSHFLRSGPQEATLVMVYLCFNLLFIGHKIQTHINTHRYIYCDLVPVIQEPVRFILFIKLSTFTKMIMISCWIFQWINNWSNVLFFSTPCHFEIFYFQLLAHDQQNGQTRRTAMTMTTVLLLVLEDMPRSFK